MKIVILDGYTAQPDDLSWEALEEIGELTVYDRTSPKETVERAKDADIVLTNKVCLRRPEIEQLPKLKYIGVLATGYNVVDIEAASEHGIVVTNVPAYSTESVAQMVFAHLLTITNRVEHYTMKNRDGAWTACPDFCYWDTPLTELTGKTFGIVGLGNIGQRVAAIAQAFGMRVVAYTSKAADQLPSGPLVCDQDVADALKANRLRAYCADVLTEEPPKADNPLLSCENAFVTPHIAWATTEARARLIDVAIGNIKKFMGGQPMNVVSA